jgi:hypothetical protein
MLNAVTIQRKTNKIMYLRSPPKIGLNGKTFQPTIPLSVHLREAINISYADFFYFFTVSHRF